MTTKINIPLLVLDFFIILPITIIRLVLIYAFGSKYGVDLIDQLLNGNSKGITSFINQNLSKKEDEKIQNEKTKIENKVSDDNNISEDVESDDLLTDISTLINTPKLPNNNDVFNGVYPVRINKKKNILLKGTRNIVKKNVVQNNNKHREQLEQKEKKEKERITKLMKMISDHKSEISEHEIETEEMPNKIKKSIFKAISNIEMDNGSDSESESIEQKKKNDLEIIQSIIKKKEGPRRVINMETESNNNIKINRIEQDSSDDESDSDSDIVSENRIDLLNED